MSQPTYPAAQSVARTVEAHFARQCALARQRGDEEIADPPSAAIVQAIVDAAFWASLRREEGKTPRVSLAWLPSDRARHALTFDDALPLAPAMLAKIAPAVERPGIHLGVWAAADESLQVWGTTRNVPQQTLVIEVVASGLIVIKQRSETFGKFVNVAVLEGDQIKIVDPGIGTAEPDCPAVVTSLLGSVDRSTPTGLSAVLVQLATSMQAHGRGGALLVVPSGTEAWRESLVRPVLYAVNPPFSELGDLIRQWRSGADGQEDVRRAVDAVAGLTAVDGATIMSDRYEVLAFGAKIRRRRGSTPVDYVTVTEPIEGSATSRVTPAQLGGTRHLSAAQFVQDQRGATALVASQDGRFTVFQWSAHINEVHAHRVDALLL